MLVDRTKPSRTNLRITLETLINLRWTAIIGQFIAISVIEFGLQFSLPYFHCLFAILCSVILNIYLEINKSKFQTIDNFYATISIFFDLVQLIVLLFLTGGLSNPFSILILVPSTISVTYLSKGSSQFIITCSVIFSTVIAFYHLPLPSPFNEVIDLPKYYKVGLWFAHGIGIAFLGNYAYQLGRDNWRRSLALSQLEKDLSKERVMNSVGGIAAAAVHELGTPLATISLVSKELKKELGSSEGIKEDLNLLLDQANRCREILKDIANKSEQDKFFDFISPKELINEIVFSLDNKSNKTINVLNKSLNERIKITQKTEIVYALRNFIENSLKFADNKIDILVNQNKKNVIVTISDDGQGFSNDIIQKLGQPYLSSSEINLERKGMGLGIFISKNLLERTSAKLKFRNKKNSGAEIRISWTTNQLQNL